MVIKHLFDYWLDAGWGTLKTICQLHDPTCSCINPNKTHVLDFDSVKEKHSITYGIGSPASVDALLRHKNKELLFIEIKGWKNFLKHRTPVSEKKIDKQLKKYNHLKKLTDSLEICLQSIRDQRIEDEESFRQYPKRLLIITDINIRKDPLQAFAAGLTMLASTSTDWSTICANKMEEDANAFPYTDYSDYNMRPVHFISCYDYDNYIKQL